MNSLISIHLLILIAVCLPWCCCRVINKTVVDPPKRLNNITINDIDEALNYTIKNLLTYYNHTDDYLPYEQFHVQIGSPTHGQLIYSQPNLYEHLSAYEAEIVVKASRYLKDRYCWGKMSHQTPCIQQLTQIKLEHTSIAKNCLFPHRDEKCTNTLLNYRSYDGYCNNLDQKTLGLAKTAYGRLLSPAYSDGISEMNTRLPNPRDLSISLVNTYSTHNYKDNSFDDKKTIAMAYWMLFIGHDLSHTAISTQLFKNKTVNCCHENGMMLQPRETYMLCAPIMIPKEDRFYSRLNRKCMNYVRSVPAIPRNCTFGPREQLNQVTHFLDGSMIYGSTTKQAEELRNPKLSSHLMTTVVLDGNPYNSTLLNYRRIYMPWDESQACQHGKCFRAADIRANTHPHLAAIHTMWLREHNRLAKALSSLNPHWNNDKTFNESRKIVIASIQHITYSDWLPALLGKSYNAYNGLGLAMTRGYDKSTHPTVSNSFATAVLPIVNSMFDDTLNLYNKKYENHKNISLREYFNQPGPLLTKHMDDLIRGLSIQNTRKVDMLFTETMTNYLYSSNPIHQFGMDIVSLDIQRSRDHGIPSYTEFRKFCGLKDIKNEQDLTEVMVKGATEKLLKKYKTWNDIDLMIGALLEKHEDDAMVGPTIRCIITEQFKRTKMADRYFYDLSDMFNRHQLAEVRKVTLARIFCNNLEDTRISMMQKNVFLKSTSLSEDLELCNSDGIPKLNLKYWIEPQNKQH